MLKLNYSVNKAVSEDFIFLVTDFCYDFAVIESIFLLKMNLHKK